MELIAKDEEVLFLVCSDNLPGGRDTTLLTLQLMETFEEILKSLEKPASLITVERVEHERFSNGVNTEKHLLIDEVDFRNVERYLCAETAVHSKCKWIALAARLYMQGLAPKEFSVVSLAKIFRNQPNITAYVGANGRRKEMPTRPGIGKGSQSWLTKMTWHLAPSRTPACS